MNWLYKNVFWGKTPEKDGFGLRIKNCSFVIWYKVTDYGIGISYWHNCKTIMIGLVIIKLSYEWGQND